MQSPSSHPNYYSIIYLYQYRFKEIYLLILDYNQALLYFVAKIVQALTVGSSSMWLIVLLPHTHHCVLFCLSNSLNPGAMKCSRLILYTSRQNPRCDYFSQVFKVKCGIIN